MLVVLFLKSKHSTPSGGRLNFSKNTDFCTSDFHLCGRRFHKNCPAEFNESCHNNYIEGVASANCSIFIIWSFGVLWWNIELDQKYRLLHFQLTSMWTKVSQKTVQQNQTRLRQQLYRRICWCTFFNFKNLIIQCPLVEDQTLANITFLLFRLSSIWTKVSQKLSSRIHWNFGQQLYRRCCWCILFDFKHPLIQRPLVEDRTLAYIQIFALQTHLFGPRCILC